jgi:hypothetical protein
MDNSFDFLMEEQEQTMREAEQEWLREKQSLVDELTGDWAMDAIRSTNIGDCCSLSSYVGIGA